jgi:hypothetical protein
MGRFAGRTENTSKSRNARAKNVRQSKARSKKQHTLKHTQNVLGKSRKCSKLNIIYYRHGSTARDNTTTMGSQQGGSLHYQQHPYHRASVVSAIHRAPTSRPNWQPADTLHHIRDALSPRKPPQNATLYTNNNYPQFHHDFPNTRNKQPLAGTKNPVFNSENTDTESLNV